jgi:CheY-like chemotaxis protein
LTNMTSVLVVDDDADIVASLTDLLTEEGLVTYTASDGAAALAFLGKQTPSVIILDVMMPGMDGIGFRHRQLADPRLSQIPVVLMSAGRNNAQLAAHLDVWGYIQKPFDVPVLLQMLQAACAP